MPTKMKVIEGLFPEEVRCVTSADVPNDFELLGAERDQLALMTVSRRREFIQGRSCARVALAGLGLPGHAIPSMPERAPVWPDGVVGSISHCDGIAAAAVAWRADFDGIGLDLEAREPLDEHLLPMICREEELAEVVRSDIGLSPAKLIFSAKESVFKCVWPHIRRFIDFDEVEVRLDLERNTFEARPRTDSLHAELFQRLSGRFGETDTQFVTSAILAPRAHSSTT